MCTLSNNDNDKKKQDTQSNLEHTARLRPIIVGDEKQQSKKKFLENKILSNTRSMSDSYRKKYIILGICVFLFFVIAYQFVKVKDVNLEDLGGRLQRTFSNDTYIVGDDQILRRNYGIDPNEIESYIYMAPKSNMNASEILILKCKPEYASNIMARIQKRIDSQSNSFKTYAKDQYEIISNSELKKKGDYIYFISSNDMETVNNLIKECYR